jgi:hypothetical protein
MRGNVTTHTYGFPSTYRQVEKFTPANTNPSSGGYAGYKEAEIETVQTSIPKIISNFVFWFALLHLLSRFIRERKQKQATAGQVAADRGTAANRSTQPEKPDFH